MSGVLIGTKHHVKTDTHRDGHMMTEEDWCDASTSQGIPTVASNNQKPGEGP